MVKNSLKNFSTPIDKGVLVNTWRDANDNGPNLVLEYALGSDTLIGSRKLSPKFVFEERPEGLNWIEYARIRRLEHNFKVVETSMDIH